MTRDWRFWYERWRVAAYVSAAGFLLWTVIIILPFSPFADLPPIIVGGGPAAWFLIGYVLYSIFAAGGLPAMSALIFIIETYEERKLNNGIMLVGFSLLFTGMTVSCILLGVAGAMGGYALTIQHSTVNNAQSLLTPYVNPITAFTLIGVAGAVFSIFGMITASKASPA